MFKEDEKEVEEIIKRVCAYLREVMYDELTQSIKRGKKGFELPKELTCIRFENVGD